MPRYVYKARDRLGTDIAGIKDADDKYQLARLLRQDGYILLGAQEPTSKKKFAIDLAFFEKLTTLFRRVKLEEKIIFSKNLGVMISAGMPLTRALDAMARESRNKYFKEVLNAVTDEIRQGHTLTDALGSHPNVFPQFYISMVEAGEKSGKLQESLAIVASQMQADYDLLRKVRGAVIYPAIILIAMVGISIFMLIYVVPTLRSVFTELGIELPVTTRFIIGASSALLDYALYVIIAGALLVIGFIRGLKNPKVKRVLDKIIIKIPIIGHIARKFNAARTARTLSSLISSGVQILEALEITGRVVQNHLYSDILAEARTAVQKGEVMSKIFLKHEDLYPALMGEMLAVGEETGESSKMLTEVAVFYEGQVADATRDLSTVVEPFLMIVIGAGVGFFAVSMIQPMYSISSSI